MSEGTREIAWALAVLDERQRRQLATLHTRFLNEQGRELNLHDVLEIYALAMGMGQQGTHHAESRDP
jgi:hypothetical protein